MPSVIVVVLQSVVEAVEGLEPAVGGGVLPVAVTEMPLAHHVGGVAKPLKRLRKDGLIVRKELAMAGHDDSMLSWSCQQTQG